MDWSKGFEGEGTISVGDFRIILDTNFNGFSGRVENWHNGQWGQICDDTFEEDNNGAKVVCRYFGLPWTNAYNVEPSDYGDENFLMDDVTCIGEEFNLYGCSYSREHNCGLTESIAVVCDGEYVTLNDFGVPLEEPIDDIDTEFIDDAYNLTIPEKTTNEFSTVTEDDRRPTVSTGETYQSSFSYNANYRPIKYYYLSN